MKLASKLCIQDRGPFPVCHVDFGHNNIVVGDNYKILGVIDFGGGGYIRRLGNTEVPFKVKYDSGSDGRPMELR